MAVTCPDCGHNVPEGKRACMYCGASQGEEVENTEPEKEMIEEDFNWSFSLGESKRPIHLSPVIQALIFIVSAAIGGFLVFLMS